MTEKRKPTYDLTAFKDAFSSKQKLAVTGTALRSAAVLGFGRAEIVRTIQTMQRRKTMNSRICPETGAPMHRDVRPLTLTYKGESLTFNMPGWYGDASEESIHTGDDMKLSDRMLNRLKALVEGLLKPEEIRRIRKKLALTQTEAGQMIGGGPRAFQKYESGDLLPSRAISSALTLLDHDPKALTVLKTRKKSGTLLGVGGLSEIGVGSS